MKRKLILIIIFVFLLVHCLCLSVLADDVKDEIISSFGDEIRDFENSLPDYVKDSLPNDIFNFDITSPISDKLSANTILNSAIDQLFANIPSILNSVSLILIAVIISSIFNTATDGLESSAMKETYGFCSTLCISLAVFNFIGNLCIRSISYMGEICKVMTAFTPLMTAIQLVSGKLSTAALGNASFNLFIILIENVLMVFTVPIVKACFCFVLVKAISGEKDIGGIIRLIKSTFLTVTGFCMMVFSFVFSMQNILTQSADSLSMKTARFALGSFVPIVGPSISEALSTITSSMSFIKNSCGIIAIVAVVLLTLPTLVSIYLSKLCFDLCASLAGIIGCEREKSVISDASGIISFILILTVHTCIFFIYSLTIFIKSSVGGI